MPHIALLTPAREERLQYGKSLRRKVSRASHAEWDPKRRDLSALELLRASERGRVASLLPINHAVGRAKRQVEELTDDAKDQVADAAEQVKGQAEHAWDKIKDAARDAKEKVTGRA